MFDIVKNRKIILENLNYLDSFHNQYFKNSPQLDMTGNDVQFLYNRLRELHSIFMPEMLWYEGLYKFRNKEDICNQQFSVMEPIISQIQKLLVLLSQKMHENNIPLTENFDDEEEYEWEHAIIDARGEIYTNFLDLYLRINSKYNMSFLIGLLFYIEGLTIN